MGGRMEKDQSRWMEGGTFVNGAASAGVTGLCTMSLCLPSQILSHPPFSAFIYRAPCRITWTLDRPLARVIFLL